MQNQFMIKIQEYMTRNDKNPIEMYVQFFNLDYQDFIHDLHFFFSTFHIYVIYKHLWYLTQLWNHGSSSGILLILSISVLYTDMP